MAEECLLCAALIDSVGASPKNYNRIILETNLFAVVPSVGPLLPGHVMVVSKGHFPSLASMGEAGINGYRQVINVLRTRWPNLMANALETEHGGVEARGPGPCIVHTHVNLIPHAGEFANILNGELPTIQHGGGLEGLIQVIDPYFFMKVGEEVSIYQGKKGQSQLIRRLIATARGRDDWNWTVFTQEEWITKTIQLWLGE